MGHIDAYFAFWGREVNLFYTNSDLSLEKRLNKKTISSHRFVYMLYTRNFDLPPDMQVSHRCHNKRCVNPEHLSVEPGHVNHDRQICRGIFPVRCRTHSPYQDCLL